MKTYIINYYEACYSADGKSALYISGQTEHGWEHVRVLTGQEADDALEELLYSEREELHDNA